MFFRIEADFRVGNIWQLVVVSIFLLQTDKA